MSGYNIYDIKTYHSDIDKKGLKKTWQEILSYILGADTIPDILKQENLGELYEEGLAYNDKENKKKNGVYYTPEDVSFLMADLLKDKQGKNICDIGCGTGNLITAYLKRVGEKEAISLLKNENIWLYDSDEIAVSIAKTRIAVIYGKEYKNKINVVIGDFLDKNIKIPENAKIISNPPYAKITKISKNWEKTENIIQSKELYSAFMEKIINNSLSSVIITPYSFLGGEKFLELRENISKNNEGLIISFDNVPGNIFKGKKYGIFNSNHANSVRASITLSVKKEKENGYQTTPLIRFKNEEREKALNKEFLFSLLSKEKQVITDENPIFIKCFPEMEELYKKWREVSTQKLKDLLVSEKKGVYSLNFPNAGRYFTVASKTDLNRTGKYILYFDDIEKMYFTYCFLNSSFAYWYWRLVDGGISFKKGDLFNLPVFFSKLNENDKKVIRNTAETMMSNEGNYFSYKMNAGKLQQNIKFPREYIRKLDSIFLEIIGSSEKESIFDVVHANCLNYSDEENFDD